MRGVSAKLRELGVGGVTVENSGTRTTNGASIGRYDDSASADRRWRIVAAVDGATIR